MKLRMPGLLHGGWDIDYAVTRRGESLELIKDGALIASLADPGALVFTLEKDLTIELEYRRSDLYFLHGAVLGYRGQGIALVAPSGVGKSTTCMELLEYGWAYLSDELVPLDPADLTVHPYPFAPSLKLPADRVSPPHWARTSRSTYVALSGSMGKVRRGCTFALRHVFFLLRPGDDDGCTGAPASEAVSAGTAAARLYANALNPLAHSEMGLDAAIRIARQVRCWNVCLGDPARSALLIRGLVEPAKAA